MVDTLASFVVLVMIRPAWRWAGVWPKHGRRREIHVFHGVVEAPPITGRDQCGWLFAGNALLIPAYGRAVVCVGRNKPAGRVKRLAGVSGGTGTDCVRAGLLRAHPWRHGGTTAPRPAECERQWLFAGIAMLISAYGRARDLT